ncbi:MAG: diguanylate cyclase [Polyangiaceae bacterium]|nr:diguanylate cyclase [Polyangiaceae bacterium]
MNILFCDDDPEQRELFLRRLENLGHTIVVADGGREAWCHLRSRVFDVVITDWWMPGMDGLELSRRIRRRGDGYTYVIIHTARTSQLGIGAAMRAGADDFIPKPISSGDLADRLIAAERVCTVYRGLREREQELLRLNRMIERQARTDVLTGISNRTQLAEDFAVLGSSADRYQTPYAIVMCDVDAFKAYNDHYGHILGDRALRRVAQTIAGEVRASDSLYRYGGEEFLAVLAEQDELSARRVAERIVAAVAALGEEHRISPYGVVTVSAGVAAHVIGTDPWDTVASADSALFAAKDGGRNQVCGFSRGGLGEKLA